MSLKDQILAASDLPSEKVEVPEWDVTLYVRTMTGTERDSFEQSVIEGDRKNLSNIRARLCVRTIVDSAGTRVFDDSDADALGKKSGTAIDRIFDVAQRLNMLRKEDIEELGKNSGGAPSGASTSN